MLITVIHRMDYFFQSSSAEKGSSSRGVSPTSLSRLNVNQYEHFGETDEVPELKVSVDSLRS